MGARNVSGRPIAWDRFYSETSVHGQVSQGLRLAWAGVQPAPVLVALLGAVAGASGGSAPALAGVRARLAPRPREPECTMGRVAQTAASSPRPLAARCLLASASHPFLRRGRLHSGQRHREGRPAASEPSGRRGRQTPPELGTR